ncbi:sensor histidine kinase [Georgenia sp. MJ170]|uniref:sensor histidine kinase n=1 Tax=Georgenia sunbinii TaxID=3117728 RepID=UPI002F26BF96
MEIADRPVLRSRVWLTAGLLLALLVLTLSTIGIGPPAAVLTTMLVAAVLAASVMAWALLRSRHQRRVYEDELTAWAAERAAQAERLRIARDLHDLASHGLGLITVRAAAAQSVSGPGAGAEHAAALVDIERSGRAATTELRRMLALLRTPGTEAPLRPANSLADLAEIVDAARAGGVVAELDVGELGEVSAGTQLTVCAVVREALTNTARHAGPTTARVTVRRTKDAVLTTVVDDGPALGWTAQPGAGTGLVGLRERVAALQGSMDTENTGRGYLLVASVPETPSRPVLR